MQLVEIERTLNILSFHAGKTFKAAGHEMKSAIVDKEEEMDTGERWNENPGRGVSCTPHVSAIPKFLCTR